MKGYRSDRRFQKPLRVYSKHREKQNKKNKQKINYERKVNEARNRQAESISESYILLRKLKGAKKRGRDESEREQEGNTADPKFDSEDR